MTIQATRLAHEQPAVSTGIHPMHEDIARLAYSLWQEQGCHEGTQEEHWLSAEQELSGHREVDVQAAPS
jgi:hypothetical protein